MNGDAWRKAIVWLVGTIAEGAVSGLTTLLITSVVPGAAEYAAQLWVGTWVICWVFGLVGFAFGWLAKCVDETVAARRLRKTLLGRVGELDDFQHGLIDELYHSGMLSLAHGSAKGEALMGMAAMGLVTGMSNVDAMTWILTPECREALERDRKRRKSRA